MTSEFHSLLARLIMKKGLRVKVRAKIDDFEKYLRFCCVMLTSMPMDDSEFFFESLDYSELPFRYLTMLLYFANIITDTVDDFYSSWLQKLLLDT